MKNRILALILCLALLSGAFCVLTSAVAALSEPELAVGCASPVPSSSKKEQEALAAAVDMAKLESYLRENFVACKKKINLEKFKIHTKHAVAIIDYIRDEMPDIFHLDTAVLYYTYYPDTQRIAEFECVYTCTAKEYPAKLEQCRLAAEKMLRGIKGNNKLTDVEKALLLHDRMALHCEYDYDNYLQGTSHYNVYTIYGVLVDRVAVCQGYAAAYTMLLAELGIDSYVVDSDDLNHAWNIVYINGNPYHVDVTWDDAVWDINGRVNHNNFLRSNAGIYASGHTAYDYDKPAYYTDYDNMFWMDYTSAFILLNNEIYYVDQTAGSKDAKIRRCSDKAAVVDVSFTWAAEEYGTGYAWNDNYTRLATDGTYLYYNSGESIYRWDVNAKKQTKIYTPDLSSYYAHHIFGFTYDNGYLVYDIETSPNFDAYTFTDLKYRYAVAVKGDVNGNGKVDAQDYALAKRHCLKTYTLTGEMLSRADLNGNGKLEASEYALIKRQCLGTYII